MFIWGGFSLLVIGAFTAVGAGYGLKALHAFYANAWRMVWEEDCKEYTSGYSSKRHFALGLCAVLAVVIAQSTILGALLSWLPGTYSVALGDTKQVLRVSNSLVTFVTLVPATCFAWYDIATARYAHSYVKNSADSADIKPLRSVS